MLIIKQLNEKYTELWKEYIKFLEMNSIKMSDVDNVYFIYTNKMFNNECIIYNPNLTVEECCMYNISVDDDANKILVDNDFGRFYVKLKNEIIAFRCSNYYLRSSNYRFLNQYTVNKHNISERRYKILNKINFLV
jgi:hypothetical protein